MTNTEFFVSRAISYARQMPLGEGISFLQGMLTVADGTSAESPVRNAYNTIKECDEQLELIASGQLKLQLPATPAKGRK